LSAKGAITPTCTNRGMTEVGPPNSPDAPGAADQDPPLLKHLDKSDLSPPWKAKLTIRATTALAAQMTATT